ncbi:MAG: O-antigen ligase family protein [Flavisolibacter sp.]
MSLICVLSGVLSVILLGSRTSVLCIITAACILFTGEVQFHKKYAYGKVIFPILSFAVLFVALLFLKSASTSGRLFVLNRALHLMVHSMPFGIGPGNFGKQYMYGQADYFSKHSLFSNEALYADDIYTANNTFIQFICETGIFGTFFLLMSIAMTAIFLRRFWKNGDILQPVSFFVVIIILCFFSYPFYNDTLRVFVLFSMAEPLRLFKSRPVVALPRPLSIMGIFVVTAGCFIFMVMDVHTQFFLLKARKRQSELVTRNSYSQAVKYDYRYVAELEFGKYLANDEASAALPLLLKARENFPSSGLCTMIGDCYVEAKNYQKAEEAYWCSIRMVPNRFVPKYKLFKLYVTTGDTDGAKHIATMIRDARIKVPSPTVDEVKSIAEAYLDKNQPSSTGDQ